MMRGSIPSVLALLAAGCSLFGAVNAQTSTGIILGRVVDPRGSSAPSAEVVLAQGRQINTQFGQIASSRSSRIQQLSLRVSF